MWTILIITLFILPLTWSNQCPKRLSPSCTCEKLQWINAGIKISCKGMDHRSLAHVMRNIDTPVGVMEIYDSKLPSLHGRLFQYVNITKLGIWNSGVMNVHESAFIGLEEKLVGLTLSLNKLSSIPSKALSHLHVLQNLDLTLNRITTIPEHAFEGNPSIQFVDLGHNRIPFLVGGIFHNMQNLQILNMVNNSIAYIKHNVFRNLTNLTFLTIASNKLQTIERGTFHGLPNLAQVDLENNQLLMIRQGTFRDLPNLSKLSLANNRIRILEPGSFHDVPKLDELLLSNNRIPALPHGLFTELVGLRYLHISKNNITYLAENTFKGLIQLRYMYLQENQIREIEEGAFSDMKELFLLQLSNNELFHMRSKVFKNLEMLQNLYLNNNKFLTLREEVFEPIKATLKVIGLEGNPWLCDCELMWLHNFLSKSTHLYPYKLEETLCSAPLNFINISIARIDMDQLGCPPAQPLSNSVELETTTTFQPPPAFLIARTPSPRNYASSYNYSTNLAQSRSRGRTVINIIGERPENEDDQFFAYPQSRPPVDMNKIMVNDRASDAISIKWAELPEGTNQGYKVFHGHHGDFRESRQLSSTTNKYTIRNLSPGTQYVVCLVAIDQCLEASTLSDPKENTKITSTHTTSTSVSLDWTIKEPVSAGFKIMYRQFGSTDFKEVAHLQPNARSFTITNLLPSSYLIICVVSRDNTSLSSFSWHQCTEIKTDDP